MQQKANTQQPIMYGRNKKTHTLAQVLKLFGWKIDKESRCPWHDKYLQLPLMSIEYHITDFPIWPISIPPYLHMHTLCIYAQY